MCRRGLCVCGVCGKCVVRGMCGSCVCRVRYVWVLRVFRVRASDLRVCNGTRRHLENTYVSSTLLEV